MITFPRARAGPFRALAGRCRTGRAKGPAPPLVLAADGESVTLFTDLGEATLAWTGPQTGGTGQVVVPMSVLEALEGHADGVVEFHPSGSGRVDVRWADHGRAREAVVNAVEPDEAPAVPELPEDLAEVPAAFVRALHEAGRTAARAAGRYAAHRIQVQGSAGRVVATDTHQALIQPGFAFPFAGDVLVPAVPVFGAKELRGGTVRVGRTDTHFVVAVGPWTVWLALDADGRFPDVAGIVPKTGTVVALAEADARFLRDALPTLPRPTDDVSEVPVTLDAAGGAIVLRTRNPLGSVTELPLPASTATGPPVRVAVPRDHLTRLVGLGFRTLRLNGRRPLVALDEAGRTYVAALLDAEVVLPPTDASTSEDVHIDPSPTPKVTPMKSETNGHAAPAPPPPDGTDPLAEAEALRTVLADAAVRAGRLVAALKQRKKESKALNQVWSSLKSLNLGP